MALTKSKKRADPERNNSEPDSGTYAPMDILPIANFLNCIRYYSCNNILSSTHFFGLTWATGETKGGIAMQCDKNDYRGVLAALEGVTGKKDVNSDAMAAKS